MSKFSRSDSPMATEWVSEKFKLLKYEHIIHIILTLFDMDRTFIMQKSERTGRRVRTRTLSLKFKTLALLQIKLYNTINNQKDVAQGVKLLLVNK